MSYKITSDCIGCTLCAKSCPVQAITGNTKEIHSINEKRCVNCGVCGTVCSKSAVVDERGNICKKVPKTDWLLPVVSKEKCTACGMCVDICGFDCLSISYPKFQGDFKVFAELIDEKKCVNCKMCANICPVKAIRMGGRV